MDRGVSRSVSIKSIAVLLAGVFALVLSGPAFSKTRDLTERPDVPAWLGEREPSAIFASITNAKILAQMEDEWPDEVSSHSAIAARLNERLYPNPNLQGYINAVGQSLIPESAGNETLLSFKIVNDPIPEVYSLSTGTVFITTGMVSMLENESQLAYVLAHETSHVLLSHHLYKIVEDVNREARAKKRAGIFAALGAIGGAAIASSGNRLGGAAVGGLVGVEAGLIGSRWTWLGSPEGRSRPVSCPCGTPSGSATPRSASRWHGP